jgi:hypothetical protein
MVAIGYGIGAALMLTGAIFEHKIGIEAAGKRLESISNPLQSVDKSVSGFTPGKHAEPHLSYPAAATLRPLSQTSQLPQGPLK